MACSVNILLNSGSYISVDNLKSIDKKSSYDGSVEKIQDFSSFHLPKGQQLCFIGEKDVVAISSSEIKYVQFSQD